MVQLPDQMATAMVGLVAFTATTAVLTFAPGTPLALLGGITALCVVPGCGLLSYLPVRDRLTRVLAVLAASLTWSTLVSAALADVQLVTRSLVLWSTAGLGGLACLAYPIACAVLPTAQQPLARPPSPSEPPAAPAGPAARRFGRRAAVNEALGPTMSPVQRFTGTALVALAALLGLLSMLQASDRVVGDYGLIPVLGWPFVASTALAVSVVIWALAFRAPRLSVAGLCLLLLSLNGTPAALVTTTLSSWNYKHFGVVDYIVNGGALSDPLDVYQQWPGFFAGAASLVVLTNVSPLTYANWAQLFFEALNALAIFGIARRLAPRRMVVPHIAVLLFITSAWEGQRYYAPQTLAFLMSLLLQYFMLPLLRPAGTRFKILWQHRKVAARAFYVPPTWAAEDAPMRGTAALLQGAGLIAMFVAITITHQLTPYVVFLGAGALWFFGVLRRTWLLLAMAAVLAVSFYAHRGALTRLPWFTGFHFSNLEGGAVSGPTSGPQALASQLAQPIGLGIWAAAFICVLSYRRHFASVAVPALLSLAPFTVILLQNYGGEAIYRVFLFTSPWCALVIAMRLSDLRRAQALRWTAIAAWSVGAALGSLQAQGFGLLPLLYVTPGEITASEYFLDNAPQGATLVLAASNFPSRINGRYTLHNGAQSVNDPSLSESPSFRGTGLAGTDPAQLARDVNQVAQGEGFLVVGPAMLAYDKYYGIYEPGTLERLVPRLKASRSWKVWYDRDGVTIFEARP